MIIAALVRAHLVKRRAARAWDRAVELLPFYAENLHAQSAALKAQAETWAVAGPASPARTANEHAVTAKTPLARVLSHEMQSGAQTNEGESR